MKQEEMYKELEGIMKQLSPNRQRYLLELARAAKRAERCLEEDLDEEVSSSTHTK